MCQPRAGLLACSEAPWSAFPLFILATERLPGAHSTRDCHRDRKTVLHLISGRGKAELDGCLRYIVAMSSPARAKAWAWSSLSKSRRSVNGDEMTCVPEDRSIHTLAWRPPRNTCCFRSCSPSSRASFSVAPFVKQTLSRRSIRTLLMIYLGQVEPDAAVRSGTIALDGSRALRADVPRMVPKEPFRGSSAPSRQECERWQRSCLT